VTTPAARDRYVCVHGHFYQPARENPWLGRLQAQPGAHPYHDWNERITAECYAPNAAARILDAGGRIRRIVNNYATISFDVGPTLLGWLARESPGVYAAILEADRASCLAHDGHGAAVGHSYSHPILPLCDPRDRRTQLAWGLRDFERRFGRRAEGLWLPETAVDLPTLEALADHGILFTILAPEQAARVRPRGEPVWRPLCAHELDTTRPYAIPLPSGREIAAFFFHGGLARGVAFERLLDDGAGLARRLIEPFTRDSARPQLAHLATDGETFGHHHRFGEMALAHALDHLARTGLAQPTHYASFLARFPPADEVQIREQTAWSCTHGLDRWSAGCDCGARDGWSQAWRPALRAALDDLRARLALAFATHAGELLRDPWAARDDYIEILLDGSAASRARFLERHAPGAPAPERQAAIWQLLESQRQALLMFTSCGWFFDDVSRIETVQNLRHAARAVELCREVTGVDFEPQLQERLAGAASNVAEHGDARRIYVEQVLTARVPGAFPVPEPAPRRGAAAPPASRLDRALAELAADSDPARIEAASALAREAAGEGADLWDAQNELWALLRAHGPTWLDRARDGGAADAARLGAAQELAAALRLAWPEVCAGDPPGLA